MEKIELPKGIRFADRGSKQNYRRALAGELNEYGFKPLILITASGPGKGKTRLARHILEARFASAAVSLVPSDERGWQRLLLRHLKNRIPYLFLDDVGRSVTSQTLATFLTAKEWAYKKAGSDSMDYLEVNLQVVLTGNYVELSEQLARRSIWIELA